MGIDEKKSINKQYKVGFMFFESYFEPSNGISKEDWENLKSGKSTELKNINLDFLENLLHNNQIKEI